jgi:hypothetical protein
MHLGTNSTLCKVGLPVSIHVSEAAISLTLDANINKWFTDPYTYDFNVDGNYIMGNMQAMSKIAANGYNVFSIR